MSADYHLWLEEKAKGPFTIGQLRAMWNSGQITAENHFTTDAGENWRLLTEILELLEPSVVAKTRPKVVRGWLMLLLCGALLALMGLYLAPKVSELKSAPTVPANPPIPVEVKLALNKLRSSTDTGINAEDYKNLVISLKTAIATYGDKLNADQKTVVNAIALNYELSVELWNRSHSDGGYDADWIALNTSAPQGSDDELLLKWLSTMGISYVRQHPDQDTNRILSRVWTVINREVDQFLITDSRRI